jgi:hypothetical protein
MKAMQRNTAKRWITGAAALGGLLVLAACSNWPNTALLQSASAGEPVAIDQARALAGVGRGDAPGFPVQLSTAGHYRLTSDLVVPAGSAGIVISAAGVHLDLNGFTIRGPMAASNDNANGVHAKAAGAVVRNGNVRGFSGTGVQLDAEARLENLEVSDNAGMGVHANTSASRPVHLRQVRALRNGMDGFWLQTGTIEQSRAEDNGRTGFALGALIARQDIAASGNRGFEGDVF